MLAGASRGSAPNSEGGRETAGEGRLRWNMVRKNASNHTLAPRTVLSSPRIVVDADSPPAATGPHPSTDWWITTARPAVHRPAPHTRPCSSVNVRSTHSDTRLFLSRPMLIAYVLANKPKVSSWLPASVTNASMIFPASADELPVTPRRTSWLRRPIVRQAI